MKNSRMVAHRVQLVVLCGALFTSVVSSADPQLTSSAGQPTKSTESKAFGPRETRMISGWTVHVSRELLDHEQPLTDKALKLLDEQLQEITRVIPKAAAVELQKVPLYISPEYPGVKPKAEYHPGKGWLVENGRDPEMVKAVEFTNVRVFEAETNRMPNFALHELAHAYHDRVLPQGFNNPELVAAYARAKDAGIYERVERHNGNGRPNTFERSYAMANPMEYFAECTEGYFARNDYFPFTCDELKRHDPDMFELLGKLWNEPQPKH